MELYRYELGSDDSDEDVIALKKLIGRFDDLASALYLVSKFYEPVKVNIEEWQVMGSFQSFTALPADGSEPSDECLWLIG